MPVTPQDTFDWLLKYAINAAESLGRTQSELATQTKRGDDAEATAKDAGEKLSAAQAQLNDIANLAAKAEEFRATVAPAAPADSVPADGQ
jgi:hypothetical protein